MASPPPGKRKNKFSPRKSDIEQEAKVALFHELADFLRKKASQCPEYFALETDAEALDRQRICRGEHEFYRFSIDTFWEKCGRYRYRPRFLEKQAA